jgi:NAD(P)-dependent dehydrogenase (short-subunit alcohol dehydrogenase family)
MRLRGRVGLVTGAGSGIGRRTAMLMAREGARVAVLSRTMDEVGEAVEEIRAAGGEAIGVGADISVETEIREAIADVADRFGRLELVFANAGINGLWAPIEDLPLDEWNETVGVNLTGTFLTLKYAVPHLKKAGGSIVINSSVNGTRVFSNTGATAYAATKAAQVAMTKMLALELAADRVRINVVCPGAIETDIGDNTEQRGTDEIGVQVEFPEGWHPLRGDAGKSDHVARAVVFLLSDEAEHITGSELWIDGGESLLGIRG